MWRWIKRQWRDRVGRLRHRAGWGCGLSLAPPDHVVIGCDWCVREMVEPRVLATPCARCGHILYHHGAGPCRYCDCDDWQRPATSNTPTAHRSLDDV